MLILTIPSPSPATCYNPEDGLLAATLDRLQEGRTHRVLAFVDEGVARHHPNLCRRIGMYFDARDGLCELVREPRIVPGGEVIKTDYRLSTEITGSILEHALCRRAFVLAVGGGAVLDAVGFAASIVHRGLRMVRVPTTVLAQNDAGVGVKNAMNLRGGKNTIGTFHPPFAVLNDFFALGTVS